MYFFAPFPGACREFPASYKNCVADPSYKRFKAYTMSVHKIRAMVLNSSFLALKEVLHATFPQPLPLKKIRRGVTLTFEKFIGGNMNPRKIPFGHEIAFNYFCFEKSTSPLYIMNYKSPK